MSEDSAFGTEAKGNGAVSSEAEDDQSSASETNVHISDEQLREEKPNVPDWLVRIHQFTAHKRYIDFKTIAGSGNYTPYLSHSSRSDEAAFSSRMLVNSLVVLVP